ncbi:type VI secretion system-associated protein TagF [Limnobacter sp.]|uniref:type VI secretion system-associated protein TagF n=1 Tax=Limnobacter sp. TaxID=2003368 RepID=UPI003513BD07
MSFLNWAWFGKLPGAGDFSVFNLHPKVANALDDWICNLLQTGQTCHGQAWTEGYLSMPMLAFELGAQCLGPEQAHGAQGVWMPSVDSAGRSFPLMLLSWQHNIPPAGAVPAPANLAIMYAVCEKALVEDWSFSSFHSALAELRVEPIPLNVQAGFSFWGLLSADGHTTQNTQCKGLPTLSHFEQWMQLECKS